MTDDPRTPSQEEPEDRLPDYEPPQAEDVSADQPAVTAPGAVVS